MKVLHNKWPCCKRSTRLRLADRSPGDQIERQCPHCLIDYRITFTEARPWPNMDPFLKVTFDRNLENLVFCDTPGCESYFLSDELLEPDDLRAEARKSGWATKGGDLCPDCSQ
jgi:hypothetical protein